MSVWLWIPVVWVGFLAVGLAVLAVVLRRRDKRERARRPQPGRRRRSRPGPRRSLWRRLPVVVRSPGKELPKRHMRRVIKTMPGDVLNETFARIVRDNNLHASTLDSHNGRFVNEVVPDNAIDGEDPQ